ncbi:hypothetical protein BJ508DRAFT_358629 [Ascobolus immersus RN42]|uniref:Uncharacterized protein n=1 Tax=Ascobolus immersus RN42 TaxID=1160509 RepID=A0A3N4IN98_ASCIM|nr:hypothetical protein BJ508DRAFT_358629 [Ascobolus immersus RN42]
MKIYSFVVATAAFFTVSSVLASPAPAPAPAPSPPSQTRLHWKDLDFHFGPGNEPEQYYFDPSQEENWQDGSKELLRDISFDRQEALREDAIENYLDSQDFYESLGRHIITQAEGRRPYYGIVKDDPYRKAKQPSGFIQERRKGPLVHVNSNTRAIEREETRQKANERDAKEKQKSEFRLKKRSLQKSAVQDS